MKAAISGWLIGALLVLCNTLTFAQTTPPVSGASLMGTFSSEITIGDEDPYLEGEIAGTQVEFVAWLTSGGETIISINANSTIFSTPCTWAQTVSLKTLMHVFALAGIERALQLGYIPCVVSPATGNVKVYYPTCVQRNITGTCPVLTAASGSSFSCNLYSYYCVSGVPAITYVSSSCGSGSCGTGYEQTCW